MAPEGEQLGVAVTKGATMQSKAWEPSGTHPGPRSKAPLKLSNCDICDSCEGDIHDKRMALTVLGTDDVLHPPFMAL